MQVYILNPDFEVVGVIDEAESTLWIKKYNDVGESEIYIPCTLGYLDMLKKGNYIFRYDDDMFCKIETIEIQTDAEQGDYIIATAKDYCNMLSGRCITKHFKYSGALTQYIYRLIDENVINPAIATRKINNFIFDTSNFEEITDTIETSTTDEGLLNNIITACKSCNCGFRLSYDIEAGQLVFRLYKGKNKATTESGEYIEFSPEFSNILSSSYKEDESNYKNVACVGYETTAGKFATIFAYIEVEEPQGDERRELFVDGSGISRDVTIPEVMSMFSNVSTDTINHLFKLPDGTIVATYTVDENGTEVTLTDAGLKPLLQDAGRQALVERVRTQEFSGNVDMVDTYEYKVDYNLGDVVKVINEYGIEAQAVITGVTESDDNDNGYQCEPKFEYIN